MTALPTPPVPARRLLRLAAVPLLVAAAAVAAQPGPKTPAPGQAGPVPPAAVLDPAAWHVAGTKGNTFAVGERDGRPVVTATGKALQIVSAGRVGADTRIRARFRFTDPAAR